MRLILYIFLMLVIIPMCLAASMDISITVSGNDIVQEDFSAVLDAGTDYGAFEFSTYQRPLKVIFDGDYSIYGDEGNYTLIFFRNITPGQNRLEYSLLYDNMVERAASRRYLMTSFDLQSMDDTKVRLTLPAYHILSSYPSTVPSPYSVTTDGRVIQLVWYFEADDPSIAVAYESEETPLTALILGVAVALAIIGIGILAVSSARRKAKAMVYTALSDEEQAILSQARKGEDRQDKIAEQLGFSKSKMSKVLRKLEEKGLVEKNPFFRTNKIRIKRI